MTHANELALSGANVTGSSAAIDGRTIFGVSAIATFSDGTAAGTLSIQVSNDVCATGALGPFTPTNWIDLPETNAKATVAAGAISAVYAKTVSYRWYRVHWIQSAGAGTLSVQTMTQGA